MLRVATDFDVNGDILRGLRHRLPALDLVRAQEVGRPLPNDPLVLDWAAAEGRVLITSDRHTLIAFAWDRVRRQQPMPGVIVVKQPISIGQAIDELCLMAECLPHEECANLVRFIPL